MDAPAGHGDVCLGDGCRRHPYERVDGAEVMRRWPQMRFDEQVDALIQADTGIAEANKAMPPTPAWLATTELQLRIAAR